MKADGSERHQIVQAMAPAVLRHRLVLNYEAAADSVTTDDLIAKIIELMPLP